MKYTPPTVLIIDDCALSRELFHYVLGREGYAVLEAEDGAAGLRLLLRLEAVPSVIFVDVFMPVISGNEFLSLIAKHRQFSRIPIVVISGASLDEVPHGARCTLTKPIEQNHLRHLTARLCERRISVDLHGKVPSQ